jgi:hypothetical protein
MARPLWQGRGLSGLIPGGRATLLFREGLVCRGPRPPPGRLAGKPRRGPRARILLAGPQAPGVAPIRCGLAQRITRQGCRLGRAATLLPSATARHSPFASGRLARVSPWPSAVAVSIAQPPVKRAPGEYTAIPNTHFEAARPTKPRRSGVLCGPSSNQVSRARCDRPRRRRY